MSLRRILPEIGLVCAVGLLGCSTAAESKADSTGDNTAGMTTGSDGTVTGSSVGTMGTASVGGTATSTNTSTSTSGVTTTGGPASVTSSVSTVSATTSSTSTSTTSGSGGAGAGASVSTTGGGGAGPTTSGGTPTSGNATGGTAETKFLVFLLLGQSNMEGAPQPESTDREENSRIKVLAYDNCPSLNREYGEWYTASPPLHSCGGGVGPGDYFAKTLLESLPQDYTIGLVPCGVNGAPIDLFLKDVPRNSHYLPPDDHWETGYEWIITRAQEAQKTGTIAGILFHQGESNNEQPDWVGKVQGFVSDLRTDLGLGEVPFLAGEMYYQGAGAGHNELVQQLPGVITNAHVISASGLTGTDQWHFDLTSQRELGTRYGEKMQEVLVLP